MKLNELHICDLGSRSPGHGHAISGRDIRITRVQINFAATAGREHDPVRPERFYFSAFFIQDIGAQTPILCGKPELGRCDQINRHVIL
jgi:hypothetical protein